MTTEFIIPQLPSGVTLGSPSEEEATQSVVYVQPISLPSYTLGAFPNPNAVPLGTIAFCSNARNPSESAGAGTGCVAFVKLVSGVPNWCAIWSGVAVTV